MRRARPREDLTPEQREARIAELRARRRARMRVLAIRSAIGIGAISVLLLVLLYWLLQTVAGRDVLLSQIVARLPADASLAWARAEGPVAGPLTLHEVRFRWKEIRFDADRVHLDADIRPLLGRRLRLDVLEVDNALLALPPSEDEPFELPSWPQSLPQITMPLAIQADTVRIDGLRIVRAGEPLIDIRSARGGLDIGDGYFVAEALAVDSDRGQFGAHGRYAPRDGYETDLVITALFPAQAGRTQARLGLIARGDVDAMRIGAGGSAPAPLRAWLDVRGREKPSWRFAARSEAFDPAVLGAIEDSLPFSFDLHARGAGGAADLGGRVQQGRWSAVIEPSRIAIADEVLSVQPLAVRTLDGLATLRGRADFGVPENPQFKFAINARDLRWGDDAKTAIGASADFGFAGRIKDWAAIGKATLVRDGERATLDFDGRGSDTGLRLERLQARMPTGTLDARGQVDWAPRLGWDLGATLAGFDPGYFFAGWNGSVSGNIATRGQARDGGGFDATAEVPNLRGRLRDRALDGRGRFALAGDEGSGELALQLGGSRVSAQGRIGDTLEVAAEFAPLQLQDLLPDGSGSLAGHVRLDGPRAAPDIDVRLDGQSLRWNDWQAESLSVQGQLPWRRGDGTLAVRGSGVQAGVLLDEVRIDAHGAVEDLRLSASARNAMGAIALDGAATRNTRGWQGSLDALRITPARGGDWNLQAPARFAQDGAAWRLDEACLRTAVGGALCAHANWPREGLFVRGDALPLALVQPWLPPSAGRPLILRGDHVLDASLRPAGKAWQGRIHLASLEGGLKLGTHARGEIIRYDNFTFDAEFDPQRIRARLGTGFQGDGYVDATVETGWDAYSPLQGDIYLHNSRLFWLELFSPDLVRPRGVIAGHIALRGTRGQPSLGGEARLTEFTGELPSLGITLSEGQADLVALPDGSATLRGAVKSGQGTLRVDGTLGWNNDTTPLQFNVRGDDVLVADTADLRAVASPDLQVGLVDRTIQVRGQVGVPSATIDVEKLSEGVSASEDVVVLDPADPERAPSSRLDLDMAITLGDAVQLRGFGLEGTLAGTMRVRSRPGQEMVATGRLDVDGRYTAYGQKLDITRGELTWSNNAVSDPRINIRAEREVVSANVTAGIDVTGRAGQPKARVWSDPALSESEALAYLVLGRSLNTASSDESQRINAASSALSAGAGLLASQLGAQIGLDDAGVLESRTLGGAVFGVGKYLSPKLYVSYGVSMVGAGSAVTLKYLLRKGFDIEIESSTIESRGSINWRKEK